MLRSKPWLLMVAAALVTAAIWGRAVFFAEPVLSVTFLDVGEGLCAVARTPSGKTMVVDCGTSSWRNPEAVGESVAAAYLRAQGIDSIDLAVLSHPHADHVSGYARLLHAIPAKTVLDIGARHASPYYTDFLSEVKRSRATYRIARRGQLIGLDNGVVVQVLNPDPSHSYEDLNDRSMVLRITYRQIAFLLAADAGEETERSITASGMPVRSQILQVGHHGSAEATSPEWLSAVHPQVAVVTCGRRNEYGHPSRETVARLEAAHARVYRTDRHGAVEVSTNGSTIRVRAYRPTP